MKLPRLSSPMTVRYRADWSSETVVTKTVGSRFELLPAWGQWLTVVLLGVGLCALAYLAVHSGR